MANPIEKIRVFVAEVVTELKKSSWPTRKELVDSTIVVVVSTLILGVFVALADLVFIRIVNLLTKSS
jgi:preprotein translocase subunit SecE